MNDVVPAIEHSLSEVFAIEKKMYSEHLGVAGTVDCVGVWNNRKSIIDWKTSKKIEKSSYNNKMGTHSSTKHLSLIHI